MCRNISYAHSHCIAATEVSDCTSKQEVGCRSVAPLYQIEILYVAAVLAAAWCRLTERICWLYSEQSWRICHCRELRCHGLL
jgi:hypothetical protein